MTKIIKWDFMNFLYECKIFNVLLVIAIVLAFLVPNSWGIFSWAIAGIISFFGGIYLFVVSIWILFRMIQSLKKEANFILPVEKKAWQIILGKEISNLLILAITFIVCYLLQLGLTKFNTSNISFFQVQQENWLQQIASYAIIMNLILFIYMMTRSFKVTRQAPVFSAIGFIVLILIFLFVSVFGIQAFSGAGVIYNTSPFSIQVNSLELNPMMYQIATVIFEVVLVIGLIGANIYLLDKRYEA